MTDYTLQLKQFENPDRFDRAFSTGDIVRVYSEKLDRSVQVEIKHIDEDKLGGNVLEKVETPYLKKGDHLHLSRENVAEILEG